MDTKPNSTSEIFKKLSIALIVRLTQRIVAFETWKSHQELDYASNNTQPVYDTRSSHLPEVGAEIGAKK